MNYSFLASLACIFLVAAIASLWGVTYMRALNKGVLNAGTYLFDRLPASMRIRAQRTAELAGSTPAVLPYGCFTFCCTLVLSLLARLFSWPVLDIVALFALIATSCQAFRLHSRARRRTQEIISVLPAHLDLLAMLLASGLPLMTALRKSTAIQSDNELRRELRALLTRVRAGAVVEDELQRFARLYARREITLFVSALKYARRSGTELAIILKEQARHRRNELFVAAEQQALEAPVKLMLPLITCIFPGTLVVLIVVISAKLVWGL